MSKMSKKVQAQGSVRGTNEANDETYAEKMTLSEKARPPSIRGLREAVGSDQVETIPGCIGGKVSW